LNLNPKSTRGRGGNSGPSVLLPEVSTDGPLPLDKERGVPFQSPQRRDIRHPRRCRARCRALVQGLRVALGEALGRRFSKQTARQGQRRRHDYPCHGPPHPRMLPPFPAIAPKTVLCPSGDRWIGPKPLVFLAGIRLGSSLSSSSPTLFASRFPPFRFRIGITIQVLTESV
jgi:hypothetical protein